MAKDSWLIMDDLLNVLTTILVFDEYHSSVTIFDRTIVCRRLDEYLECLANRYTSGTNSYEKIQTIVCQVNRFCWL